MSHNKEIQNEISLVKGAANLHSEYLTTTQMKLPAVPIQRVTSGKTNTEELQAEKNQHSINGIESKVLASYGNVPPDDEGSNGHNHEKTLQGKFKSPNPLQFKNPRGIQKSFPAPPLQLKTNTIQKQEEEQEEQPIQQKSTNPNGLPNTIQTQMENALGADFSSVNIHTNSQSATDVGALAYTQGNDVHFAPGQYNPETNSGQELIGHELTHVVQQREGRVQPTTQAAGLPVNDYKGLEAEADEGGRKVVQGRFEGKNHNESSISFIENTIQLKEGHGVIQKDEPNESSIDQSMSYDPRVYERSIESRSTSPQTNASSISSIPSHQITLPFSFSHDFIENPRNLGYINLLSTELSIEGSIVFNQDSRSQQSQTEFGLEGGTSSFGVHTEHSDQSSGLSGAVDAGISDGALSFGAEFGMAIFREQVVEDSIDQVFHSPRITNVDMTAVGYETEQEEGGSRDHTINVLNVSMTLACGRNINFELEFTTLRLTIEDIQAFVASAQIEINPIMLFGQQAFDNFKNEAKRILGLPESSYVELNLTGALKIEVAPNLRRIFERAATQGIQTATTTVTSAGTAAATTGEAAEAATLTAEMAEGAELLAATQTAEASEVVIATSELGAAGEAALGTGSLLSAPAIVTIAGLSGAAAMLGYATFNEITEGDDEERIQQEGVNSCASYITGFINTIRGRSISSSNSSVAIGIQDGNDVVRHFMSEQSTTRQIVIQRFQSLNINQLKRELVRAILPEFTNNIIERLTSADHGLVTEHSWGFNRRIRHIRERLETSSELIRSRVRVF